MKFVIKLLVSVCVISICAGVARKMPSLAGLIALMTDYTKSALWGIVPSILFFLVAFVCFHKQFPLWIVLCASFSVWLVGAFFHQRLLSVRSP